MSISLPSKHIAIDMVNDTFNINKIKALLKFYNKDCDLECEEPYNVYYVTSVFMSFNYSNNVNFYKCINVEDDKTFESFEKQLQETIKKKKILII